MIVRPSQVLRSRPARTRMDRRGESVLCGAASPSVARWRGLGPARIVGLVAYHLVGSWAKASVSLRALIRPACQILEFRPFS